jgi:hypothetical protein
LCGARTGAQQVKSSFFKKPIGRPAGGGLGPAARALNFGGVTNNFLFLRKQHTPHFSKTAPHTFQKHTANS